MQGKGLIFLPSCVKMAAIHFTKCHRNFVGDDHSADQLCYAWVRRNKQKNGTRSIIIIPVGSVFLRDTISALCPLRKGTLCQRWRMWVLLVSSVSVAKHIVRISNRVCHCAAVRPFVLTEGEGPKQAPSCTKLHCVCCVFAKVLFRSRKTAPNFSRTCRHLVSPVP